MCPRVCSCPRRRQRRRPELPGNPWQRPGELLPNQAPVAWLAQELPDPGLQPVRRVTVVDWHNRSGRAMSRDVRFSAPIPRALEASSDSVRAYPVSEKRMCSASPGLKRCSAPKWNESVVRAPGLAVSAGVLSFGGALTRCTQWLTCPGRGLLADIPCAAACGHGGTAKREPASARAAPALLRRGLGVPGAQNEHARKVMVAAPVRDGPAQMQRSRMHRVDAEGFAGNVSRLIDRARSVETDGFVQRLRGEGGRGPRKRRMRDSRTREIAP